MNTRQSRATAAWLCCLMLSACGGDAPSGRPDGDTSADAPTIDPVDDPIDAQLEVDEVTDAGDATPEEPEAGDAADAHPDTPPTVLRSRFGALDGEDFYRLPWPLDARRLPGGQPDLSDFPGPPRPFVSNYLSLVQRDVVGFAAMPVIYIAWNAPLAEAAVPEPSATLANDGAVQLIDLNESRCGHRTPVVVHFDPDGNDFRPPDVLMATPVPGFGLDADGVYGLVVTAAIGAGADLPIEAPQGLVDALAGSHAEPAIDEAFAPLRACLGEAAVDGEIVAATVFTVQDARAESLAIRDAVMDPEQTAAPVVADVMLDGSATSGAFTTWTGTYDTPIFQRGESPYSSQGGGFVFDDGGAPVIQRWEAVPFVVTVPNNTQAPYPVLIFMGGTGASLTGHLNAAPAQDALAAGLAVAAFLPQFTGERAVAGSDPSIHGFNWPNPESGRTAFRQQAVDTSYFIRVLREGLADQTVIPELATDRLVYGGQSQGALIGALLAGIEPEIVAFGLNGTGAYLSATLVERTEPVDFAELLESLLGVGDPIDVFHPVVQLVQLAAEPVDPVAYAPFYRGWESHSSGSNVFLINGGRDPVNPRRVIDHLTIAGDLAPVAPPGWDVDPWGVWDRQAEAPPLSDNRSSIDGSPLTMASHLAAEQEHFTMYQDDDVRARLIHFWTSALEGTPELPE